MGDGRGRRVARETAQAGGAAVQSETRRRERPPAHRTPGKSFFLLSYLPPPSRTRSVDAIARLAVRTADRLPKDRLP